MRKLQLVDKKFLDADKKCPKWCSIVSPITSCVRNIQFNLSLFVYIVTNGASSYQKLIRPSPPSEGIGRTNSSVHCGTIDARKKTKSTTMTIMTHSRLAPAGFDPNCTCAIGISQSSALCELDVSMRSLGKKRIPRHVEERLH